MKITAKQAEQSVQALVNALKQSNLPVTQERALIGALVKTLRNKRPNPFASRAKKKGGKVAA